MGRAATAVGRGRTRRPASPGCRRSPAAGTSPATRGAPMDPTRFDQFTRMLGGASGRRALLRALLGAALGSAAPVSAKTRDTRHGQNQRQGKSPAKDRVPAKDPSADQAQGPDPTQVAGQAPP